MPSEFFHDGGGRSDNEAVNLPSSFSSHSAPTQPNTAVWNNKGNVTTAVTCESPHCFSVLDDLVIDGLPKPEKYYDGDVTTTLGSGR